MLERFDGTRGDRPSTASPGRPILTDPRGAMFLSLLSAFAVGLVFAVAIATAAISLALGLFDRRDYP